MRLDLMVQAMNEGERLKREGMKLAADRRPDDLLIARDIAKMLCKTYGKVTSDQVQERLDKARIRLGNAAGSIFKGGAFVPTHEFVKSTRKSRHAGLIRVWRLK